VYVVFVGDSEIQLESSDVRKF